jgi:hypothetical protein
VRIEPRTGNQQSPSENQITWYTNSDMFGAYTKLFTTIWHVGKGRKKNQKIVFLIKNKKCLMN